MDKLDPHINRIKSDDQKCAELDAFQVMPHPEHTPEEQLNEYKHEFVFESSTAKSIKLAGSFNNWKPINDLANI